MLRKRRHTPEAPVTVTDRTMYRKVATLMVTKERENGQVLKCVSILCVKQELGYTTSVAAPFPIKTTRELCWRNREAQGKKHMKIKKKEMENFLA